MATASKGAAPQTSAHLRQRTTRLLYGASAAVTGSCRALADPSLRVVFWKNLKILLGLSLALAAVLHLLLLPVEWLGALFLEEETLSGPVRAFRYAASATVPFLLVSLCRSVSVGMFEDAFFAGVATRDAALAIRIRKHKAIYWDWEYVRHLLRFGLRQAAFGLLALLAAPLLGVFIPVLQFGYRIRHMEPAFLVPLFLAFCLPMSRSSALQVLHLWLDARAMVRELFDPIIARLKSAAKTRTSDSSTSTDSTDLLTDLELDGEEHDGREQHKDWHHRGSDAARLGFALVFSFLLQLPFLGPFTWFLGFMSAGLFAPELVDLSAFGDSSKTT